MLLSAGNAEGTLSRYGIIIGGFNIIPMATFLSPFINLSSSHLLLLLAISAVTGFLAGTYTDYRARFGTTSAFFFMSYFIFAMEFMLTGGAGALAMRIMGRPDLCWPAFFWGIASVLPSLIWGAHREARSLGWYRRDQSDAWRKKLEKHIDYVRHCVIPADLSATASAPGKSISYAPTIVAAGQANLVLLFEIFGGGRTNAIFICVPLLAGAYTYLNIKYFGPALARLLLLRKLERESGRSFANADYEKIQELRRSFYFARWLMRDYHRPGPSRSPRMQLKP